MLVVFIDSVFRAEAKVISRRGRSKGYGFVTFENEKDAIRAYNSLNKAQFEDREINIELAKPRDPKAEPPPYPPRAFQPSGFQGGYRGRHRGGRGGKRVSDRKDAPQSTTTLFISNLPYKIDDESLSKVFDGYDIVKSYVVTTRYGRSRGYGFVEFSSEPEQQRALKNLNNVVIDERQLTVRIAFEQAAKEESPDSETAQA